MHAQLLGCRTGFGDDDPADDIDRNQRAISENQNDKQQQTHQCRVPTQIGSQATAHTAQHLVVGVPEKPAAYLHRFFAACPRAGSVTFSRTLLRLTVGIVHLFGLAHTGYHPFHIGQGNHLPVSVQLLGQQFGDAAFDVVHYFVGSRFLAKVSLQVHQIVVQQAVGIFVNVEYRSAQVYSQCLFHCYVFFNLHESIVIPSRSGGCAPPFRSIPARPFPVPAGSLLLSE